MNPSQGIVFIIITAVTWSVTCSVRLTKPFTLKLAVSLPVGGNIAPLDKMCTKSIDLLLALVNNRSDLLPNYNLVIDLIDDQCRTDVAVRNIFPYFLREKSVVNTSQNFGQFLLPSDISFAQSTAEVNYVPPLLIGGMCSAICEVVSKYMGHFDVINFSAGCHTLPLANLRVYPNFYRIMSNIQEITNSVTFVKRMGWTKVAIVADVKSYQMTSEMISFLFRESISVLGVEFFIDDPQEAVSRVKSSGARIIFANCYFDSCPRVACQAYWQKLYGPRIVWVFPPNTADFVHGKRPPSCTEEMAKEVERGSMFGRDITPDYLGTATEIGLTGAQLDRYLEGVVPNLWNNSLVDSRFLCFDNILPAVYILDSVDKTLNSSGSSLRDLIQDHSAERKVQLRELVRHATENLNIRTFSGKIRFENGAHETHVPAGMEQSQKGVKKMVFVDNGVDAANPNLQYVFQDSFFWLTNDEKAPKSQPTITRNRRKVPRGVAAAFSAFACAVIIFATLICGLQIYLAKKKKVDNFQAKMTCTCLFGLSILVSIIIAFPYETSKWTMQTFCWVAPPLAIAGYTLISGSLVAKLLMGAASSSNRAQIWPTNSRQRNFSTLPLWWSQAKSITSAFVAWFAVNFVLFVCWYSLAGPPIVKSLIQTSYNEMTDEITDDVWETCTSSPKKRELVEIFGGLIFGQICGCMALALLLSVTKTSRKRVTTEAAYTSKYVYVLFPALIAAILAVVVLIEKPDVMYYFLSLIVLLKCAIVLFLFYNYRRSLYNDSFREISRTIIVTTGAGAGRNRSLAITRSWMVMEITNNQQVREPSAIIEGNNSAN